MKEEILYAWLRYILDIISTYFAQMGKPVYGRKNFFQEELPDQLWTNITNFIVNLANLPLWRSPELSNTIFGGKQTASYWSTIFSTGKSPSGEQILTTPLDIIRMIQI